MKSSLVPHKSTYRTQSIEDRIRIFLVDDHPAIRQALAAHIEMQMGMEVCGEAGSAEETLTLIEQVRPNAMIVDISLEDVHGLDLVETITKRYPDIRVIVYSMYDENVYAERALLSGARAYVMKLEPSEKVIEAVRTVIRGSIYLSRTVSTRLLTRSISGRSSGHQEGLRDLTDREMTVFRLLAEGMMIEEIADQIHVSRKTAEQYRRQIKKKLDLTSTNALIQFAVRWKEAKSAAPNLTN